MITNANKLNDYLKAIFDIEDDIYKSMISDPTGTPEITIVNPIDLNYGTIADLLEWNRLLTQSLKKQLFFDQAEGKYIDLIAHDHFGLVRSDGEIDADYIARVKDIILGRKLSPASIIVATTPYSSPGAPEILEGEQESAFADLSFSDNYIDSFVVLVSTSIVYQVGWYVFPAIALDSTQSTYFFILILENTASGDIPTVVDIVNRYIAAGINYEIWIYTV